MRKRGFRGLSAQGPKKLEKEPKMTTILTQLMADEFNFLWSEIENCIAEADADLIPVPGQLELVIYMVDADMVSCCLHALESPVVADLLVELEE